MSEMSEGSSKLTKKINEVLKEEGVIELFNNYQDLCDNLKEYDQISDNLEVATRMAIYRNIVGEDEGKVTIDKKFTLKDGSVFIYSATKRATLNQIADNIEMFEIDDELKDLIQRAEEEKTMDIKSKLQAFLDSERAHITKRLMDDSREFDAVSIKTRTSSRSPPKPKMKLHSIRDNYQIMQPCEDMEDKHVEELMKFIDYCEEMLKVTVTMKSDTEAIVAEIGDLLERIENYG